MANKYERALMMLEMLAMEEAKRHSTIFEKEVKACADTLASLLPKKDEITRESFVELYTKYVMKYHDKLSHIVLDGPVTIGDYGLSYDFDAEEVLIVNKSQYVDWYRLDHVGRALDTNITSLDDMGDFLQGLAEAIKRYKKKEFANGLHEDYNG